jgi:hypothetical protein
VIFGSAAMVGGELVDPLLLTLVPAAEALFRTAEFPADWWPLTLLSSFPPLVAVELDKFISARCQRR